MAVYSEFRNNSRLDITFAPAQTYHLHFGTGVLCPNALIRKYVDVLVVRLKFGVASSGPAPPENHRVSDKNGIIQERIAFFCSPPFAF